MSGDPITMSWLLNKAWVVLIGLFWYGKKKLDTDNKARDKELADLNKEVIEMRSSYVTQAQLKELIKEQFEPYKEDQKEIKELMTQLHEQIIALSRDMAVQNAIRGVSHDQQNNGSG